MDTFNRRLPSGEELLSTFAVCAFPVHVWAIFIVMQEVPAWILRLTLWDLLEVISFDLAFALVESIVVFLVVCLIAIILPPRWLSQKLTAISAVTLLVFSLWIIFLHYNNQIIEKRQVAILAVWGISLLMASGGLLYLVHRRPKFEGSVKTFAQRLSTLSFLYLFFDVIALVIIFIR